MFQIIAQRDLRNGISTILRRVAEGETFTVTVRGEPVAELAPIRRPRQFLPWAEVVALLASRTPDPDLLAELREAAEDTDKLGRDRAERLFGA